MTRLVTSFLWFQNSIDQAVSFNIPDDSKKLRRLSQHCKSSQTESACIATKCINVANIMSPLRDMKLMSSGKSVDLTGVLSCRLTHFLSCDKNVDLTGVLLCRATLFECFAT